MPKGEAVTGGAQCTAAAERRRAGTVEQWARQGDGGAAVRGVGEGQREVTDDFGGSWQSTQFFLS